MTTRAEKVGVSFTNQQLKLINQPIDNEQHTLVCVGKNAYINLLTLQLKSPLQDNTWVEYDVFIETNGKCRFSHVRLEK